MFRANPKIFFRLHAGWKTIWILISKNANQKQLGFEKLIENLENPLGKVFCSSSEIWLILPHEVGDRLGTHLSPLYFLCTLHCPCFQGICLCGVPFQGLAFRWHVHARLKTGAKRFRRLTERWARRVLRPTTPILRFPSVVKGMAWRY